MSLTLNGSAGVTTNSGAVYDGLQTSTAVASTSGTSIDFTGIPAWVKRITVMFSGVSTNGTSPVQVQIGNGAVITTGYLSTSLRVSTGGGIAGTNSTTGFLVNPAPVAADVISGSMTLSLLSSTIWVASQSTKASTTVMAYGGGDLTISGTLDRVRITTVNGTDTFDAGTINIIYE